MWYFTWVLGLGFAVTFGVLNGLWHEFRSNGELEIVAIPANLPAPVDHLALGR